MQRLFRAAARYLTYLRPANGSSVGLASCSLALNSIDDSLALETVYNYTIEIDDNGPCTIRGGSVYGAMYGLETFAQLVNVSMAASGSHGVWLTSSTLPTR